MPKASQFLAALKRDGWVEIRRKGSHVTLEKLGRRVRSTHHANRDLGNPMMAKTAKAFGYTLEQLQRIL